MKILEKIIADIIRLHQKMDRIISIIQQLPTTHNTNLGDWLTEEQAQELLQRKTTSLWDLRKQKKIIASKIGNRTFYDKSSIIEYLEKNKNR